MSVSVSGAPVGGARTEGSVRADGWPGGLVAFWDFAEERAPFRSKAGAGDFQLRDGPGSRITTLPDGPFGNAIVLNGKSDYLFVPASGVGALDVGRHSDQMTLVAWVYRDDCSYAFVAGMWNENDVGTAHREYGLFIKLPESLDDRACGHISSNGKATQSYGHCREFACSPRNIRPKSWRMIAMTYDGVQIVTYLDGIADSYPDFTDELGVTYSKNPHMFSGGLNRASESDFTVGASMCGKPFGAGVAQGVGGFWPGRIGGIAIFNRALDRREIMAIHLSATAGGPVVCYDFWHATGYGTVAATSVGWLSARGREGTPTGDYMSSGNFLATNHIGNHFIFRSALDIPMNRTSAGIGYTENIGGMQASQLGTITFRLNSTHSADPIRLCLRIDTDWYASEQVFSVSDDGRTGYDWTTAETTAFEMTRQPGTWRSLLFRTGEALRLGDVVTDEIPDGELMAIGFYSPPLSRTNSVIRVTDVCLFASSQSQRAP